MRDMDGIEHTTTVAAESLFEAVARGIMSIRQMDWVDRLTLQAGKITVQLAPVAIVTGRLLNPDGDPVKTGRIQADTSIVEMRRANVDVVVDDFSDANGRFTLLLPGDGSYGIRASHSPYGGDYKTIKEDFKVTPGMRIDLGDFRVSQQMQ